MRWTTLLLAIAALAFAGCGGGNSEKSASTPTSTPSATTQSSSSGGGETIKLAADKSQLKFDKSSLTAKAGKVTITMDNPSSIPHGVAVEGNGVDKDGKVVNKGGASTVTASLKPGKYTFYCPVPGHRQAGMQGTLTVK